MRPGEPFDPGRAATGVAPRGTVVVCTLGSPELASVLAGVRDVSVAGCLRTANLGIALIVRAVLDRPWVRHLVVCGRESPLFQQGQSLIALVRSGIDPVDHRIVGARGHLPFLPDLDPADIDEFRERITLSDLRGADARTVAEHIGTLAGAVDQSAGAVDQPAARPRRARRPVFTDLRPLGRREPIAAAGEGFFVISTTRRPRQVVVEHYRPDLRAGHRLRGRRAEPLLLGILGAGLARSPGHAGYLGTELAKAETALRLGLKYEQDRPLRQVPADDGTGDTMTWEEFGGVIAAAVGAAGKELDPDVTLTGQLAVDSLKMMELAVVLEQDLRLTLPDDLDLSKSTPAELYQQYLDG